MPAGSRADVIVRPFQRTDRDQVTDLVNAHVAAVVPGASIPTAALLNQLEREPGEFIEDPWCTARVTLVAQQRGRIVAAAHLQRFSDAPQAPAGVRDLGMIRWLLFWPEAPFWPGSAQAGDQLAAACLAVLEGWRAGRRGADGTLPVPGVYGVPEQWPHVHAALARAGFVSAGRTETVLIARVQDLPLPPPPSPGAELTARRTLGVCGTRIAGLHGDRVACFIELDTALDAGSARPRNDGLADIGNLWFDPAGGRAGRGAQDGRWLLGQARRWLELAGVTRVLGYAEDDDEDAGAATGRLLLLEHGFSVLTRTVRDLMLPGG